jgi:hypothetical protein
MQKLEAKEQHVNLSRRKLTLEEIPRYIDRFTPITPAIDESK